MIVGVVEVVCFDAASIRIPLRQCLRIGRDLAYFVFAKACISGVHIADNDRDALKPSVIALRVGWNLPPRRGTVLYELNRLQAKAQRRHAYVRAEDAGKTIKGISPRLSFRLFLERERLGIKVH